MKKVFFLSLLFISLAVSAQDHFAGISTSCRVGILNVGNNPAELMNLNNKFEVNGFGISANISNSKISFKDVLSDKDLYKQIFSGTDPVSFKLDTEIYGPSYAVKLSKFGFAISSKLNAKFDIVDVDVNLGNAIANNDFGVLLTTQINNNKNQRIVGTTWGEIDLSGAFNIIDSDEHKFNVGTTVKLLFPGSFANVGASNYFGLISETLTTTKLTNTNANLNFAYSGGLANSFTNFNDYQKSLFGALNGFAVDLGVNYQLKDETDSDKKKYKLNIGLAIKNMGSMTFKDDNNASTDYKFSIENAESLDLNEFQNINSIDEIEKILITKGFLDKTVKNSSDFVVKLPTVFSAYADLKIISKFYLTGFMQRKLKNNNENDQVTTQNLLSFTPRFCTNYFEVFLPYTITEFAGNNIGLGLRVGGFYLASTSAISALSNNSKQIDFNFGFRYGFL